MAQNFTNLVSSTCHQLKIICLAIVICLLLVASVPLFLMFAVHYALAVSLAWKLRPDLSLLAASSAFFAPDPVYIHRYSTIIWNLICEGSISVQELQQKFKERVLEHSDLKRGLVYRKLYCRMTRFLGYYFWERDKNFDINHHVRLYDYNDVPGMSLNSTADPPYYCTEESLIRVTSKLFSSAFKSDTSPWELLVIPNYKSIDSDDETEGRRKPKTVLCLRIHHILGDGVSILGLIHRLFQHPFPPPMRPEPNTTAGKIWTELRSLFITPYLLARLAVEGADRFHAWHPHREELSCENVTFCSPKIPWEYFRAIMKKHGVSSNAAVFSVSTGAILRLLREADHDVPTHALTTAYAYPKPNHPGGLVNHISTSYYRFTPGVHSGAELVRHIGGQVRRVSEGDRTADMLSKVQPLSCLFPAWFWNLLAKRSASPTFLFSNLAGPQERLETDGLGLVDIIASVGHDPTIGIFCGMTSILGKLRIVLNVDGTILEGKKFPTNFSQHVIEAMRELLEESPPDIAGCQTNNFSQV